MTEVLVGEAALGGSLDQGNYGETFIKVLAAATGLSAAKDEPDRNGIDWTFTFPGTNGKHRYPAVSAQVKSWSAPVGDLQHWKYHLKIKHFNKLAGRGWQMPRFLFLVITPKDPADLVEVEPEHLLLRNAAYWASLMDEQPVVGEPHAKHQVRVPKTNLLTPDSFRYLFHPSWSERLAK
jgi:hypothetical protein